MAAGTYVGVAGVARKVTAQYVGVAGVARRVIGGYAGVAGVARKTWEARPMPESVSITLYLKNSSGTSTTRDMELVKSGDVYSHVCTSADKTALKGKTVTVVECLQVANAQYGRLFDAHRYVTFKTTAKALANYMNGTLSANTRMRFTNTTGTNLTVPTLTSALAGLEVSLRKTALVISTGGSGGGGGNVEI